MDPVCLRLAALSDSMPDPVYFYGKSLFDPPKHTGSHSGSLPSDGERSHRCVDGFRPVDVFLRYSAVLHRGFASVHSVLHLPKRLEKGKKRRRFIRRLRQSAFRKRGELNRVSARVRSSPCPVPPTKKTAADTAAVLFYGADYGVRTRYLDLGKVALYQMS